MRIAMLIDRTRAEDPQALPLADTLAGRGHEVTVYQPARDDEDDSRQPARFGAALGRRWHEETPDVAHAFSWSTGLAAIVANGEQPVPLVQDCRHTGAEPPAGHDLDRLESALGRRAQQAVVASRSAADALARLGVPRAAISVVPYGVDHDVYHPEGRARRTGDHPRLVCPEGPADGHSSEQVIRALPRVPDAELLIAEGHAADREDEAACLDLADALGVADRVRLLDHLTEENLAELYRSADLVVSTPTTDAGATACVEAMACGATVVATAADGRADLVVDGVTGAVVPTRGTDELVLALRRLLDDEPRRIAYGIAAADRVAACHSWDRIAGDTERAYGNAVRNGRFAADGYAGRYAMPLG